MKKELIIIGAIIVVLVGYLLLKQVNKMHYDIPKLEPVKIEDIDKIELKKGSTVITLVKKNNLWTIQPQGFPTETEKVKKITETISKIHLTDLASKSKNDALYELDNEKGVQVKAFQKDKVLRDFVVGKAASTYGHTFVKIKGDDNIYYALESFRDQFDIKTDDLRDKKIMKVDSNEISEVEIDTAGTKFLFTKKAIPGAPEVKNPGPNAPDNTEWVTPDGKKGNKPAIDSIIGQLSDFQCEGYIEGKTKQDFVTMNPVFSLRAKGNKDYILVFYPKPELKPDEKPTGEEKYPTLSPQSAYPFYVMSWKAEQIIKKPEDLLEKAKEEKKDALPKPKK